MTIQEAIKQVTAKQNLSMEQAKDAFEEIMSGKATDAQIAALIVGLRMKGETPEEITGAATIMREKASHVVPASSAHVIDTCGTGGDGANTFNISTAAAFVAAGAGATVAKHGNRSVSSKCGSADVLEALGVNLSVNTDNMKECLDTIGICFLFASALHKAMKYAIGPRKEIAVRTIFNILGPITNPSDAKAQLLGVFSKDLTETMAIVLKNLGSNRAFVVHGNDNLDEISITAPTAIAELNNGSVKSYEISPEQFGFQRHGLHSIAGGTPRENASIIQSVLDGVKGPHRDIVLLNSGFAICASGLAATPQEGILLAADSIDSGKAKDKLLLLIEHTNRIKNP